MNGLLTLLKLLKKRMVSDMLDQKRYYKIVVKNNETATVYKIDFAEYNIFQYDEYNGFEYVYHTEKGEIYPLERLWGADIDMLVADDEHLEELLRDMIDQGFCDEIKLEFVGDYNDYYKAF